MSDAIAMVDFYHLATKKDLQIVDVREAYEYERGHVPKAQNLPLSSLGTAKEVLNPNEEYYLICQSGARSENAYAFLASQGYKVTNVLGGTATWPGRLTR